MSWIGVFALAANAGVLVLLWRHRADDLNMRSVWLCSRNDVVANVGVLLAALGVALTGSGWPDIAVGLGIAALFMTSAVDVIVPPSARPCRLAWADAHRPPQSRELLEHGSPRGLVEGRRRSSSSDATQERRRRAGARSRAGEPERLAKHLIRVLAEAGRAAKFRGAPARRNAQASYGVRPISGCSSQTNPGHAAIWGSRCRSAHDWTTRRAPRPAAAHERGASCADVQAATCRSSSASCALRPASAA